MKHKLLTLAFIVLAYCNASAQGFTITFTGTNPNGAACNGTITATVTGGSANNIYYWDNAAITNSIKGLCTGTYCVTVTDPNCRLTETPCTVSGCYTIGCTTPNVTVTSAPNGDVASTGGNPNNLYLGYGPQSTTLSASASGNGTYSYSWAPATGLSCTNCASPVFTPTAEGFYTFTVTATDNNGCSGQGTITICVLDVRASSGSSSNGNGHQNGTGNGSSNKVYVCHLPPGNPGNAQTICIDVSAVPAHVPLHGGDHLGTCDQSCGRSTRMEDVVPELINDPNETGLEILTYPNPFTETFNILVQSANTQAYDLKMFDVTGRVVLDKKGMDINNQLILGSELSKGAYYVEIKQGDITRVIRMIKAN